MLNFLVDACLPPIGLAGIAFIALLLGFRHARPIAAAALAVLLLLGLPPVATLLLDTLAPSSGAPGSAAPGSMPAAIVILSADGVRVDASPDLEPGPLTLDRLRAGADLARTTGLPVLVSGGSFLGSHTSLADMMVASLRDDFHVPVRWSESRSLDTWQNAEFSARILRRDGIKRIYLVTHFWHMRRALLAFRTFGLDPVPAPVRAPSLPPLRWRDLVPTSEAWFDTYVTFHEWVGYLYYSVR